VISPSQIDPNHQQFFQHEAIGLLNTILTILNDGSLKNISASWVCWLCALVMQRLLRQR
jgi:hypothetical protein